MMDSESELPLPGPLSILLDSPVLLDLPCLLIFSTTLGCFLPGESVEVGESMLFRYICDTWEQIAEERPDEEQALFIRDGLIIVALADTPVYKQYFRGLRMRLQVAYAMLEMEALALPGQARCPYC